MSDSCSSGEDFISDLPSDVMDEILVRLPLREAVRTSVLSTKWKNKWLTIPNLVFDHTFCNLHVSPMFQLFKTIYHILLLHQNPFSKVTLSVPGLFSCPEIDNLIYFLSRNPIQELTLRIEGVVRHKLPSFLFSYSNLKSLKLSTCVFNPPPTFEGFRNLDVIEFHNVDFAGNNFETSVSLYPKLEHLTVKHCFHFQHLTIGSPRLKSFEYDGERTRFNFEFSPVLTELSVRLRDTFSAGEDKFLVMVEVFDCFPAIEHIALDCQFVLDRPVGSRFPERLSTQLDCLRTLVLRDLSFVSSAERSSGMCLIRSAPNLKNLKMTSNPMRRSTSYASFNRQLPHLLLFGVFLVNPFDYYGEQ